MFRIAFIGAGNMATNLANAFLRKGVSITCVYSKTETSARRLGDRLTVPWTTSLSEVPSDADVYIYAVKDAYLSEVLDAINAPNALHLHTAGSVGVEVFAGKNKPHSGVLYPFQTLSKERILDFSSLPIFIEASDPGDLKNIRDVAETISSEVYEADSEKRRKLHLAGVFANNFSNCMYAIAGELLAETGLPEKVLLSLIDETAAKVHQVSPREAQTGPAVRNDQNVMAAHKALLKDENLKQIYQLISDNIHHRQTSK